MSLITTRIILKNKVFEKSQFGTEILSLIESLPLIASELLSLTIERLISLQDSPILRHHPQNKFQNENDDKERYHSSILSFY